MSFDINVIRNSFEKAKPGAEAIADRFYEVLWTDFPESKPMFDQVAMPKQKAALVKSLVTIVDNLENGERLTNFLKGLGERHVNYGVEAPHYAWVGASLMKTFGEFLGDAWTPELNREWSEAYRVIVEIVLEGAKEYRNRATKPQRPQLRAVKDNEPEQGAWLPALPEEMRQHIRTVAREAIRTAIAREYESVLEDEMKLIQETKNLDYLKRTGTL